MRRITERIRRSALTILTAVAILALILSTYAVVQYTRSQAQRERDRVASDVRGCERGNELRRQIIIIGDAERALVSGVLDTIFSFSSSPERLDPLREALAPLFAAHDRAVAGIKLTDCEAAA